VIVTTASRVHKEAGLF